MKKPAGREPRGRFWFSHKSEQIKQDDDRDRNADQPEQYASHFASVFRKYSPTWMVRSTPEKHSNRAAVPLGKELGTVPPRLR